MKAAIQATKKSTKKLAKRDAVLSALSRQNKALEEQNTGLRASITRAKEHAAQSRLRETKLQQQVIELEKLATRDPLTGILNKRGFHDAMERLLAGISRGTANLATLVYIDLDRFKPVNDLLGHAAGDQMLEKFAKCLTELTRPNDYVARLGGDEFAIVLDKLADERLTKQVIKNIKAGTRKIILEGSDPKQLERVYEAMEREHVVEFSYGAVVLDTQLDVNENIAAAEKKVPKFAEARKRGDYSDART